MNNKVSIIVPVFNQEKFLKRCLDSIINQSYKNLEIIIIDDASTDKSREIIKKYVSIDQRIKPYYLEENKGVSHARNIGLKSFTGNYVIFIDSDDYIVIDAVKKMVDLSIKYDSDFVDNYELMLYKRKGKIYKFTENKIPKNNLIMKSLDENIKILTKATYIKGKLYRKDIISDLLFDENLKKYEDMIFEHQLKLRVKNYIFMNEVIYYYYQIPDSLVNTLGTSHLCYLDAAKKVKDIYSKSSTLIRNKIEKILVTNFIITLLTKIVKNTKTLEENIDIVKDSTNKLIEIFPDYKNNKNINFIIKKLIYSFLTNEKRIKKILIRTKNINFINLYFRYLSVAYKYRN